MLIIISIIVSHRRLKLLLLLLYFLVLIKVYSVVVRKVFFSLVSCGCCSFEHIEHLKIIHHITVSKKTQMSTGEMYLLKIKTQKCFFYSAHKN